MYSFFFFFSWLWFSNKQLWHFETFYFPELYKEHILFLILYNVCLFFNDNTKPSQMKIVQIKSSQGRSWNIIHKEQEGGSGLWKGAKTPEWKAIKNESWIMTFRLFFKTINGRNSHS